MNMLMKLARLLVIAILMLPLTEVSAQQRGKDNGNPPPRPEKKEWLRKMKEFKNEFMARELDLTPEQKGEFFRVYGAMEEERFEAEKSVRKLEQELEAKGTSATDEEYDRCIAAHYELNEKMVAIDKKYEASLRKILTKRQLMLLPHVERNFQRHLMEQRQEHSPQPKH